MGFPSMAWGNMGEKAEGRSRQGKKVKIAHLGKPCLSLSEKDGATPFHSPEWKFFVSFYVLAAGHSWRQKQWGGGLAGWETPFCRLVRCEQWGHGKVGLPHIPPGLSGSAEACTAHTACFFGDSGRWSKFFVPHPVKSFRLNLTENLPSSDLGCL